MRQGEPGAIDRLTLAIYDELHKIARSKMRRERNGHLLQTTALLNEAIARLLDGKVLARAPNRRYLFAAASNAMRIVLVNHARLRRQSKVATIEEPNFLDEILAEVESDGVTIEDLHRAGRVRSYRSAAVASRRHAILRRIHGHADRRGTRRLEINRRE